jgi:tetratricopeptide (TPR) repeat protein
VLDSVLHTEPPAPIRLNQAIPAELEHIVLRAIEKDRELRQQSAAEIRAELKRLQRTETRHHELEAQGRTVSPPTRRNIWRGVAVVLAVAAAGALAAYRFAPRAPALSGDDELVVADIANSTGDTVFNDALKQALIVQLRQSPYLSIVSDDRVGETLRFMGRKPDDPMTDEVTREVCQRQHVKAMLAGSIASLGTQYVIALNAINCENGDRLAAEQVQAAQKEDVLAALGTAATALRGRLGESLASVRQYDVPLVQATTPSLEALKAYSTGFRLNTSGQSAAAISHLERAVSLDAQFAVAYAQLATVHYNWRNVLEARGSATKAHALHDRATERERFYIDSMYYVSALGDLDEAGRIYQQWAEVYPREFTPRNSLGVINQYLGDPEKALVHLQEATRLDPKGWNAWGNMGLSLSSLGRLADAKRAAAEALATPGGLPWVLVRVACMEGNLSAVSRLLGDARQRRNELPIHFVYGCEADRGRLEVARRLEAELRAQPGLTASHHVEHLALFIQTEWWFGDRARARTLASELVSVLPDSQMPYFAPRAVAWVGDGRRAGQILDAIAKEWPRATHLLEFYAPIARAVTALNDREPALALEALQRVHRLGAEPEIQFCRGMAHLQAGAYSQAVTAFKEAVKRPPSFDRLGEWISSVAQVQLARALASAGDRDGARETLEQFLAERPSADPDAPLLVEAKRELARLK